MQVRDAAQHQSRIKKIRHHSPPRRRPRPESPCISRTHAHPSYTFYSEDNSTANAKRDRSAALLLQAVVPLPTRSQLGGARRFMFRPRPKAAPQVGVGCCLATAFTPTPLVLNTYRHATPRDRLVVVTIPKAGSCPAATSHEVRASASAK